MWLISPTRLISPTLGQYLVRIFTFSHNCCPTQ